MLPQFEIHVCIFMYLYFFFITKIYKIFVITFKYFVQFDLTTWQISESPWLQIPH
jgi:hypothetical protein